jgi:hypothetical protein
MGDKARTDIRQIAKNFDIDVPKGASDVEIRHLVNLLTIDLSYATFEAIASGERRFDALAAAEWLGNAQKSGRLGAGLFLAQAERRTAAASARDGGSAGSARGERK